MFPQFLRQTLLGGGTNNYDLDFLNSLDINNNNFVLSADSLSDSVDINNVKVVNESGTKELQDNNKKVDSKTTLISVSDVKELIKLSNLVNDDSKPFDFSGYTIKLTKNLTLDDPAQGKSNFTPIGKDLSHKFNGTFDGQGHTISNLQVSGVKYAGLFGYLGSDATVKNLGIINSEISVDITGGVAYSGGIAGDNSGTITNCYNTGVVTATSTNHIAYSGGIAGRNFGTITNCYNTGDVNAKSTNSTAYSGGIAGYSSKWGEFGGTIENCYNTGTVNSSGTNAYSGGIAGDNSEIITNCYNTGTVNSSGTNAYSGGIAGWNNDKSTVQPCYFKEGSSSKPIGNNMGADDCKSFNEDGEFSDGSKLLDALNEWVEETNKQNPDPDKYRYWMNEKYPVFTDWYGEAIRLNKAHPGNPDYTLSENSNGVYEIKNGYQLALIADIPNGKYIQSDNIDLSRYEWRPIGNDSEQFTGTLDGQEYMISNLSVNINSKSGNVYTGLFGYLGSDATVKNLGIIDSVIFTNTNYNNDDRAFSGGIAGYNSGKITNCYNTGTVIGSGTVTFGGIVGENKNGTVTNCYNTGTVIGTGTSGGIAGYNSGTITNCYNTGVVIADTAIGDAYSGGIVGNNANIIKNCYNIGFVTATATGGKAYSGGITGNNSGIDTNNGTIENCYNTGDVTGTRNNVWSGGIAGFNSGKITNCYNTGTVNAKSTNNDAASGGIVGDNYGRIINCYNTGTVKADSTNNDAYSGGIAGYNYTNGTITNCYNIGKVTATATNGSEYSGGIAGWNEGGTITNCYYLEGCVSNSICNEGTELTSDAMKESNLLSGTGENSTSLNKGQVSMPWSPDIFNVNDGYPILADVPTQIDPSKSANKPPQSAVYVTLSSEKSQAENYLERFKLTNVDEVAATINCLNDQNKKITSYQWYTMNDKGDFIEVSEILSPGTIQETYYVKVTIDGYSYTSLTRTVSDTFIVMFDSNGGSAVKSIIVSNGKAITEPKDPTKDNYVFAGWYTDKELTSEYDFNKPVIKDITLYAKWEAEATVTVMLDDNAWDKFEGEVYLYQNGEEKYTLNGSKGVYSEDVDLEEYQIHVKMKSTDTGDPIDTNVSIDLSNGNNSVKVQYWTVTFDYKDDETESLKEIVLNDSSVTGPEDPTRVGYEFEGWCSDKELSNKYDFDTPVTKNTTLYAKWKAIKYTVVYDANGSTSGTVPSDYTLKINDNINVDINDGNLAKSGYIFRGWNYTPNASLALPLKTPLAKDVIEKYIGEDNILTLYAVWTPIPEPIYTLCLNSNDSTLQTKRYSGTYGTEITLKSASEFGWNKSCKFIEWNSKSDGSGVSYKEGDKFSLGSETWNLYAIWSDSSYHTVSFDSNGGSNVPSQSIQDGYRASEPNAPTKQGHSFKHWSLNGTKYDFNQSVKEDITLKAEYEVISYKVTFYYNGEVYYSTQADYNTSLGDRMPSLPSDKDKWNTNEDGKGNNFTSDSLITSDISVYAVSSDSISSSILIIGGSAAAILAAIAAWMFMRSRHN